MMLTWHEFLIKKGSGTRYTSLHNDLLLNQIILGGLTQPPGHLYWPIMIQWGVYWGIFYWVIQGPKLHLSNEFAIPGALEKFCQVLRS